MRETVDKVFERLMLLEVTVGHGFHDTEARFLECEARGAALSEKIDVNTEAVRADIRTVLDAVGSLSDELRRTADSIRQKHAADRKLFTLTLQQHAKRIQKLEADS